MIPGEIWVLLAGLVGAVFAYLAGDRGGRAKERQKQSERDLDAAKKAKDKKQEMGDATDQELHDRLTGR